MKIRILSLIEDLKESYWFIPTLFLLAAAALSVVTLLIDDSLEREVLSGFWWIYGGGPEGARSVLGTVAGSMLSVAGTVYSITIAVLSFASSNLGFRLLHNFMRDRGSQIVLGIFVATFLYCLLIMRTVRGVDENEFVPYVSVSVGVVLAVISLAALVYFIHHMARSIQAEHVIARITNELDDSIDRLFPRMVGSAPREQADHEHDDAAIARQVEEDSAEMPSLRSGYVQAVSGDDLLRLATKRDVVLRLHLRPKDFATRGETLAAVHPADRCDDELVEQVNSAYTLGIQRRRGQDVEYSLAQLVEIAMRALSPSLNDPFTAITCIDWLSEALMRVAEREPASRYRHDEEGRLRIIVEPETFESLVDAAFDQIREASLGNVAVTLRLLETLEVLMVHAPGESARQALAQQAEAIRRASMGAVIDEDDLRAIDAHHQAVLDAGREE